MFSDILLFCKFARIPEIKIFAFDNAKTVFDKSVWNQSTANNQQNSQNQPNNAPNNR